MFLFFCGSQKSFQWYLVTGILILRQHFSHCVGGSEEFCSVRCIKVISISRTYECLSWGTGTRNIHFPCHTPLLICKYIITPSENRPCFTYYQCGCDGSFRQTLDQRYAEFGLRSECSNCSTSVLFPNYGTGRQERVSAFGQSRTGQKKKRSWMPEILTLWQHLASCIWEGPSKDPDASMKLLALDTADFNARAVPPPSHQRGNVGGYWRQHETASSWHWRF